MIENEFNEGCKPMRNMDDIIKVPLLKAEIEKRIVEMNAEFKEKISKAFVNPEGHTYTNRSGETSYVAPYETSQMHYEMENSEKLFTLAAQERILGRLYRDLEGEETSREAIKALILKQLEFVTSIGRSSSSTHNLMEATLADQLRQFLFSHYDLTKLFHQAQRNDPEWREFQHQEAAAAKQQREEEVARAAIELEARKERVKVILAGLKEEVTAAGYDLPRVMVRNGGVYVSMKNLWGATYKLVYNQLNAEFEVDGCESLLIKKAR